MAAIIDAVHPVLMSRDIKRSIVFYRKLGFNKYFTDSDENPRYAGVRRDNVELHLQWHAADEWNYPNDRPTYRFAVSHIDDLYKEFINSGIEAIKRPQKTGWGTYEFHVRDPDLNGLQFYKNL